MPIKYDKKLVKVTTNLFEDDYEELKKYATANSKVQAILRYIVHQYVMHAGAKLRAKIDELEKEDN